MHRTKKMKNILRGKLSRLYRGAGFLAVVAALMVLPVATSHAFDFSDWEGLLKKYVSPATIDGVDLSAVAYRDLKDAPEFSKLVRRLKTAPLDDLQSAEQKMAFWVNVYNIFAVKIILENYPVDGIKDIGSLFKSVWKRKAGMVAGKERTLHEIEHEILRKMGDPRIHAAIVCASVSCPDLRREAYVADELGRQLDEQMKAFLQNKGKGMRIEPGKQRVYLSLIFKWFAKDFESAGGVMKFLSRYVSPADQKVFNNSKTRVSYLDYNWDLNQLDRVND